MIGMRSHALNLKSEFGACMRSRWTVEVRALNPVSLLGFTRDAVVCTFLFCLGVMLMFFRGFADRAFLRHLITLVFGEYNETLAILTVAFYVAFMFIGPALLWSFGRELPRSELSLEELAVWHPEFLSKREVVTVEAVCYLAGRRRWVMLIVLLILIGTVTCCLMFFGPGHRLIIAVLFLLSPAILYIMCVIAHDVLSPRNATELLISEDKFVIRCGSLWCFTVPRRKVSEIQVVKIVSFYPTTFGSTMGWGLRLVVDGLKVRLASLDELPEFVPKQLERFVRVTGVLVGFYGHSTYADHKRLEDWRELYRK